MNRSALARTGGAVLLAGALAVVAGCAGASPGPSTGPSRTPSVSAAPDPVATPSTAPTPFADPACDTIIPADVVTSFQDSGWSSQEDVFRIGANEIPSGLTCTWGNAEVTSDNVQMFGWAPISAEDATTQETELLDQGWIREEDASGVYITEDPSAALSPDEDGYGWTYLFGDGWVKFADTKQGLLLVDWPPAG